MQEITTAIGTTLGYIGLSILSGLLTWFLILKIKISYYELKEHKDINKWKKEKINDTRRMEDK